ncbi:MAG: putative baseplate assembly protein [Tumebacillaceae bacterium]
MLKVPNLDDRFFEAIVGDARRSIPKLLPQWTDENAHDPGITMIELFSWLSEMQQYYLNRVTTKNELKFLQLLGIQPQASTSARADVTFDRIPRPFSLPRGTKLLAKEQPFETVEPILLLPARMERVLVASDSDCSDYTAANENDKVAYFAFGAQAERGNRLYIGFDRELPAGQAVSLTINLNDEYEVPLNAVKERQKLNPSARIAWSYCGSSEAEGGQASGWRGLLIHRDETVHLSQSGRITFTVPTEMSPIMIHPANDKRRYWICCAVEEAGYEVPPKINKVMLNTTQAVHRDTKSLVREFDGTGAAHQDFFSDEYLAYFGEVFVQVQESGGWRYWDIVPDLAEASTPYACTIQRDAQSMRTRLIFGDGKHGAIPPQGKGNVRLIACQRDFAGARKLGSSNGLPAQSFELPGTPLIADSVRLQAGTLLPGTNEMLWQDWTRVHDFEHSKSDDRHYVVDEEGVLRFGNHEQGLIPETAGKDRNLCLIALQLGGGERGNVQINLITEIVGPPNAFAGITVTNHFFAKGGAERESLDKAKARMRRELKRPTRAITSDDFEKIALATPGLRVARVKAIPLDKGPGQVTVVVVPYSHDPKPMPSSGFLKTVQEHLDAHRLLTTEVHVVPPEYVKVAVHAVVVTNPHFDAQDVSRRIQLALQNYLDVIDNSDPMKGWEFGRAVYKGDLYGVISQQAGVEYIQNLWFEAEGKGIRKDSSGDIHLPPHGLVYSGLHVIELVSRSDM